MRRLPAVLHNFYKQYPESLLITVTMQELKSELTLSVLATDTFAVRMYLRRSMLAVDIFASEG